MESIPRFSAYSSMTPLTLVIRSQKEPKGQIEKKKKEKRLRGSWEDNEQ
jgi:hypothetical protein